MCITLSLKIGAIQKISLLVFFKLVKLLGPKENGYCLRKEEREGVREEEKKGEKEEKEGGREGRSQDFFEFSFTALTCTSSPLLVLR